MTLIWTVGNKIDANLIPENIRKDKTIFGVEGEFQGIPNTNWVAWITIPLFSGTWETTPHLLQRIYYWWACWEYWDKIYSMVHWYPWTDQYMYVIYYDKTNWNVWVVWNIGFSSPSFEESIISVKIDWDKIITNTTSTHFVFDMSTEWLIKWWWEYTAWINWTSSILFNWTSYEWYSINRNLVWCVLWRKLS